MAITVTVDSIAFVFDFQDQRIDVPATETSLNVFTLWKAIREAQATAVGIAYSEIARAGGLDTLDDTQGIQTFITVTLFDNWEVNSLLLSGKFTTSGGNLLRDDGNDPFRDNPLITYFAFFSQAGTVTTVATGSGVTDQDKSDIADRILGRNIAGGSSGGRTVTEALRANRNRVNLETGVVYAEDDATPSHTFAVTRKELDAISEVDPD